MKNNSILIKIQFILYLLFAMTLPFSINLNSFIVILLVLNSLVGIFYGFHFTLKENLFLLAVFISLFVMYLVAVSVSGFAYAFVLEKRLSLLVFPLIL